MGLKRRWVMTVFLPTAVCIAVASAGFALYALMTLTEYLEDYASPATKAIGYEMVERELQRIPKESVREIAEQNIRDIRTSNRRDFRF